MYKVYKLSWCGLKIHIATFTTKKEANDFINAHKDYTFIVE